MEYALLRCVRAALLDARSISKLLLRDAHVRSASRNVLRTHVIVNPSVKLVPRDARCVRDACAQRCSLNLDTVDLTRTKLAHQARAAVVRGILPRDSNTFLRGRRRSQFTFPLSNPKIKL